MKSIKNVLLAGLLIAPSAAAQTVVTAGPSTEPWIGFTNAFELDCVAFVFNSGWGLPELTATFDDGAGTIKMEATQVMDVSDFWYQDVTMSGNTTPGGPGVPGNKCMDSTLYQEVTGVLNGQTVTFTGTVQSNTLTMSYATELFIRDFAPDYSQFNENSIPVVPGPFSFDLITDPDPARHVQWGLQIIGPNVWPGDQTLEGSVILGQGFPAGNFTEFCNGDGGDGMGCTDCPCGNNSAAGTLGGCQNSAGLSARLLGSGSPSVAGDSLRFEVSGATIQTFGILQSANNQLPNMGPCAPGSGILSAVLDGLRCVGGAAQRHGTRPSDTSGDIGMTTNGWGPPNGPPGGLIASSGFVAGQTRNFQCFYREGATVGCGTGQNTSNAVSVTFTL